MATRTSKQTLKRPVKFSYPLVAVLVAVLAASGYLVYAVSHATSAYDATILNDHPVAYWDLNGASSGTETDLSGHNHTGTYKGGTPKPATLLNGDTAADFNGSSEYMTVPSSADLSIPATHQLTWEGWIRPDTLQYANDYTDWMGKCQNYSPTCEWEARMYSTVNSQNRCNRLSAYVFNPGAGLGSGADWQPNCNLIQAGQWLHVVAEYQTLTQPPGCNGPQVGGINIWINGVEWSQASHLQTGCMSQYGISPSASTSPLNIGTMAFDYWFPGAVGKVAIYNYLLSQSQISAHFSAMTGSAPSGSCSGTCVIPVPTQTGTLSSSPSASPTPPPTPTPSPTPSPSPVASSDNTPPSVWISQPANGQHVSGTVTISADATDDVGVTKLEVYIDNRLYSSTQGSSLTTSWSVKLKRVSSGSHTITAKAYDARGNTGTASIVVYK